jgi:hypothetical protein
MPNRLQRRTIGFRRTGVSLEPHRSRPRAGSGAERLALLQRTPRNGEGAAFLDGAPAARQRRSRIPG